MGMGGNSIIAQARKEARALGYQRKTNLDTGMGNKGIGSFGGANLPDLKR